MFLSRRYRPNMWPYYGLVACELPLTVALLTFTGIAAPNLYRTKLWQDGANNGFNSSPLTGVYAAANYRPYTTPRVWSQFVTNYNLVAAVLSMFLLLCKSIMYMLHVLPPILSVLLHTIEIILYAVAVAYQASSDTTDKHHPQHGPAWYITKSCSVTYDHSLIGYCKQAKATFACFCAMLGLFIIYWILSLWSCFPSKAMRAEYNEKSKAKRDRWTQLEESPSQVSGAQWPETPRPEMQPVTPRTFAFNRLNGKKDLPLRATGSSQNVAAQSTEFSLRSPGILKTPRKIPSEDNIEVQPAPAAEVVAGSQAPQMYFPAPPKQSTR